jgi:two-component system response regulator FlrC
MSREAGEALLAYRWPGNVRELENVMQRALVLCTGGTVELEHLVFDDFGGDVTPSGFHAIDTGLTHGASAGALPGYGREPMASPPAYPAFGSGPASQFSTPQSATDEDLHSSVRATEYQAIMNAIRGSTNRNEAAARLGISPRTLRYKLARLREPMGGGLMALGEGAAS